MWIVPRQHVNTINVPRAFLDSAEVGRSPQTVECFCVHIHRHPAWVVIKHCRKIGGAVYGQGMQRNFATCGVGIRRRGNQKPISTSGFCGLRKPYTVLGANSASTNYHRYATFDELRTPVHHPDSFFIGLCIIFASGSGYNDTMHAGLDQMFDGLL